MKVCFSANEEIRISIQKGLKLVFQENDGVVEIEIEKVVAKNMEGMTDSSTIQTTPTHPIQATKKGGKERVFNSEEKQEFLLEAYNEGMPLAEIAELFSCSVCSVNRELKRLGTEKRRKAKKEEQIAETDNTTTDNITENSETKSEKNMGKEREIIERYNKGKSPTTIGKELGLVPTTVRRCLEKNGIQLREVPEIIPKSERLNEFFKRAIDKLHSEGKSIVEISKELDITYAQVRYYCKRMNYI